MDDTDTQSSAPSNEEAQRREARRRRILENSKNRLAKISGQPLTDEITNLAADPVPSKQSIIHPDPEIERDFFDHQQQDSSFDPSSLFGGPMAFGSAASPFGANGASPFGGGAGSPPNIFNLLQGMQGMPGGAAGDNPLFSMMAGMQSFGADGAAQQSAAPPAPAAPQSIVTKILQSKVHICALAIITYLLAATDVAFRTHVFTLFLVWEVVELFALKSYAKSTTSYLGIVFLVSGIPSEHSTVVMKWFATIRRILNDVAIFAFFFVVSHLLWQRLAMGQSFGAILDHEMVQEFDRLRSATTIGGSAAPQVVVDDEFEF